MVTVSGLRWYTAKASAEHHFHEFCYPTTYNTKYSCYALQTQCSICYDTGWTEDMLLFILISFRPFPSPRIQNGNHSSWELQVWCKVAWTGPWLEEIFDQVPKVFTYIALGLGLVTRDWNNFHNTAKNAKAVGITGKTFMHLCTYI